MHKRLFLLFLVLLSPFNISGQNPDINLLHKLNAPYEQNLGTWLRLTNSAYWIPPAYVVSNLTYGIIADDRVARSYALEGTISVALSAAITQGLKSLVGRERPAQAYPELIRTYSITKSKSFPSGHSAVTFATASAMAYQGKRWFVTVPVFSWSTTIGYSRMRLGKHYPTDVLVGAAIGVGSGIFGHWLTQKIVN